MRSVVNVLCCMSLCSAIASGALEGAMQKRASGGGRFSQVPLAIGVAAVARGQDVSGKFGGAGLQKSESDCM